MLCNRHKSGGFSLVELVMVLVLVGIVAVIAGPRMFSSTQSFDQYGFYNETISAVRYAQKRAVATCSAVRVTFTAAGYSLSEAAAAPANGCQVPCADPGTGSPVPDPVNPTQPFARNTPDGITISPVTNVVFCPPGNTLGAADVVVNVGTGAFTIVAATGFVR